MSTTFQGRFTVTNGIPRMQVFSNQEASDQRFRVSVQNFGPADVEIFFIRAEDPTERGDGLRFSPGRTTVYEIPRARQILIKLVGSDSATGDWTLELKSLDAAYTQSPS